MENSKQSGLAQKCVVCNIITRILTQQECNYTNIFENKQVPKFVGQLLFIIILLSGFYGLVMGIESGYSQMISSALKVPILYLLTLFICYPALFVVNVLMGSKLTFWQLLALILSAIGLNSILLACFAPIAIFFTLTGASYHFMKLLHVFVFAFGGIWGMGAMWRGLQAMCEHSNLYPRQAIRILRLWILIFAVVGAQMAWSLRPFVGSPDLPFQIFRKQGGNFYQAVWISIVKLSQ